MKKFVLLVIPFLLFGTAFAGNGGGPQYRDGMGPMAEAQWGTSDALDDTDNDGFCDGFEVAIGWSPLVRNGYYGGVDTDLDCFSNLAEQRKYGTNPNLWDTDNDGAGDSIEIARGMNPLVADYNYGGADTDEDKLSDAFETNILGTQTTHSDSDNDDYTDSCEYAAGTDPLDVDSHPEPAPPVGAAIGVSGTETINTNTLLILVLLLEFVIIYMLWKKKR